MSDNMFEYTLDLYCTARQLCFKYLNNDKIEENEVTF